MKGRYLILVIGYLAFVGTAPSKTVGRGRETQITNNQYQITNNALCRQRQAHAHRVGVMLDATTVGADDLGGEREAQTRAAGK